MIIANYSDKSNILTFKSEPQKKSETTHKTSLIASLLFGSPGNYKIFGIDVSFLRAGEENHSFTHKFINFFQIITFNYVRFFIHEMGHTLVNRLLFNEIGSIEIFDNNKAHSKLTWLKGHPAKESIMLAAGSVTSVIFSICSLVVSIALKVAFLALKWYVSASMALIIVYASLVAIMQEFSYAINSTINQNNSNETGDFARIARLSQIDWCVASAALVIPGALSIVAAAYLW